MARRLAALREDYASALPARIAEIDRHWQAVRRGGHDPAALDSLYRLVHGLAGSGATFGYPHISDAAQDVERLLRPGLENGTLEADAVETGIETLVRALRAAAKCRAESDS